jgi:hypothetical protein
MIMVNFMFIPLTDPKLTPELKARFVNVGQLIKWELTDPSGVYTGLVVVGEKPHPQGFQSTTEITFDIPEEETSAAKIQQITRLVQAEFVQRGVVGIKN